MTVDPVGLLNTAGLAVISYLLIKEVRRSIDANTRALNLLVRAHVVDILSRETSVAVRREAQAIREEVERDEQPKDAGL